MEPPAYESAEPGVALHIEADDIVNYAMHQNDVAVIRRLKVVNSTPHDLSGLTVSITSEPEFSHLWQLSIDKVPAGSSYEAGVIDLPLSPAFLANQTEAVSGYLNIYVQQGSRVLAQQRRTISVLAYDQWGGIRSLPEMLAAFVLPNHPIIESILAEAARLLEAWTGDSSLAGYQTGGAARVQLQAAAIYEVIRQKNIAYAGVPASFEKEGQKVRTPDRVMEARLGNCLDLSALLAACLEQCGLRPFICVVEGHAFPGVWMVEQSFPRPAVRDVASIRKRVDLGEISVFEATLLTGKSSADFAAAERHARRHLEDGDSFIYAIDTHRARMASIRPLPLRSGLGGRPLIDAAGVHPHAEEHPPRTPRGPAMPGAPRGGTSLPGDAAVAGASPAGATAVPADIPAAPPEPPRAPKEKGVTAPQTGEAVTSGPGHGAEPGEEEPKERLERWKRRLLDLTRRNRLISFRETRSTVPILFPDLGALEDALAEEAELQVHPLPADWQKESGRDADLHRERTGRDADKELLLSEFHDGRLRTGLPERDTRLRLTEIYRAARSSLEENGANTLYLALGFLSWYDGDGSVPQKRRAPLLLIPVELTRSTVTSPFTVKRRDEEATINVTLLEFLSSSFGLDVGHLASLPRDGSGIDVPLVLQRVRRAIKDIPQWDVEEEAYIGLFSFTKFLMWRDLEVNTENLKKNKLVASLIDFPNKPLPASHGIPSPDELDDRFKPSETYCPLDADSSQLAAVYAAAAGNTFIVHGPPGTGKSQTIANMIAQALTEGKTVLFVAEKMAALSVVQRRLAAHGLGEFCLELHSNKASKADVIAQLGETLTLSELKEPQQWSAKAARLGRLRDELNAYVRALHRRRSSGDTFFSAVSQLIKHRRAPKVLLPDIRPMEQTPESLEQLRETVRSLVRAGGAVHHPAGHVWAHARAEAWSPSLRDGVDEAAGGALELLPAITASMKSLAPLFGFVGGDWTAAEVYAVAELARLILSRADFPTQMVAADDWEATRTAVKVWVRHGIERDRLRSGLYSRYSEAILQLDLDRLAGDRAEAEKSWFLPRWLGARRILKSLQRAALPGTTIAAEAIDEDLASARRLRDEERTLAAVGDEARALLGRLWLDGEADWDTVEDARDWAYSLRRIAQHVSGADLERRRNLRLLWSRLLAEHPDEFREGGTYAVLLRNFLTAYGHLQSRLERLQSLLMLEGPSVWWGEAGEAYFSRLEKLLSAWRRNLTSLRPWCIWREERARAVARGLGPLVAEYEQGLPHDEVLPTFQRSYYESWTDAVLAEDRVLQAFSRHGHEDRIRQFNELDDRFRRLTIEFIRARLFSRVPMQGPSVSQNSEMGILRHEMQKKRRHMPTRALFNRIPNLLPRLKPCLLMSPISVAQYLDPATTDEPPFDLVIFDEASQIPTWDAIGAIARGKETIIVGDPKQLPPTTFFHRGDDDDEDIEFEDLESILDDCLSLHMPELYLRWHYRSRNEALITFSNAQYYNNRLHTFPSPEKQSAVKFKYVDGIYDRGRSRTNQKEAEAIVAEVVRRLRDPREARKTIGVVTFSLAQQRKIEDLLEDACRLHPEIEGNFDPSLIEPVFVKNLENVQGDERDVILFSIGYGPDSTGRMTMSFGPLNREGGQRRLNVAITRARREVIVFSSITPDQIDLTRTHSRGVRDLKTFLEFARRGPEALDRQLAVTAGADTESPFEQDVLEALQNRGYEVIPQVGSSGYRIDLAVVHPEKPGRFILGIECDGATYHSSKNARDRDKTREMVLRGLGWEIHRIWSTDWWQDRAGEVERLEAAIEAARIRSEMVPEPVRKAHQSDGPAHPGGREPATVGNTTPGAPGDPVAIPARKAAGTPVYKPGPEPWKTNAADGESPAVTPRPQARFPRADGAAGAMKATRRGNFPTYAISDARPAERALRMDFYSLAVEGEMRRFIGRIISDEGPISLALLARRVAPWWNIGRVTRRVLRRVSYLARGTAAKRHTRGDAAYFWPDGLHPDTYDIFRLPGAGDARRDAADLPPEEVSNAMLYVLQTQVALPREDLLRETARLFGYSRSGTIVRKSMATGLKLLKDRGKVREERGMYVEA